MGRSQSSHSPDRLQKKKDKKSKKDRKRQYSSESSSERKKKQKQKYRDKDKQRDRSNDRDRKKKKDRDRDRSSRQRQKPKQKKYKDKDRQRDDSREKDRQRAKDKTVRDRSRSRDKKREQKPKRQQNKPEIKQKKISRSPSPVSKPLTEEERMKKLAMRKVKARLLKLNDIIDGDNSSSDSSQQMKAPQKPPAPPAQTNPNLPPPMPNLPPMPQSNPITQPPAQNIVKPRQKKRQSRWGKTTAAQTSFMHTEEPSSLLPNQTTQNNRKLSLQPEQSQDIKLSLSQDKSIEVEQNTQNLKPLQVIDEEFIDPLDEYMMQIQGQAAQQMQLPKNQKKKIITFDQVVTSNTYPTYQQKAPQKSTAQNSIIEQNNNQTQQHEKDQLNTLQEEQDHFRSLFFSAIQKIGQKYNVDQQDNRGTMMQGNQDLQQQQENDFLNEQNQGELDFFAKQRKMAERKQLHAIDHKNIVYQQAKFDLYREAEQIKNIHYKDVVKYRKQQGDIKVRGRDILNPVFNWYQCGFPDKILTVIEKRQYGKPFPIQAQSLPLIMSGRDVIGIAETGSGKTLSYLLPVLRHIMAQRPVQEGQGPISIIMTPTRQLARQVYLQAKAFCKSTNIKVLAVYGGLGVQGQLADFRKGAQLVICTPGRMIDILTLNKGRITNLKRVTMIVIDEADRMFDLGFEPQITKIIENSRPKKQVVMFSATFPKNVQFLARRILVNPVQIIVGGRGQACRNVEQQVVVLDQTTKFLKLLEILGQWNQKGSILIFVDKQTEVDYLFQQLLKYGYHALTLHGAMDADDRQFTIYDFKKGLRNIMVATSVLARGLDIKAICLVINFKCPNHLQDYIHRIGRTGRAGTKGTAITFITPEQEQYSIDLIKALEMSEIHPPQQLKKMSQSYLLKVKKGQARKIRNRNMMGSGFKFDEEEQQKINMFKNALKKQLKSQGLAGFEDSDQQDIEMKKKKQQNIRGRSQQDRIAEVLKNPEIKGKLVADAVKAVSDAMKSGDKLNTSKILQIAIESIKQSVKTQKVVNTVEQGVQKVTQLISEFQNKGIQGADFFSYDFQINDYPLNARQKACNQSFTQQIQHQTNCSISLRGVYVEPGKKVPIGCRKLYLHIQGQNKYYVTTAYKQIKSVLEQNAYQSLHAGLAPGKYNI